MRAVIFILGILIIGEGVLFLLKPGALTTVVKFFAEGRRMYIVGVLRLVLGVICLVSAHECAIQWLIIIFGILLCTGGTLVFAIKLDKLKAILAWWQQRSAVTIRLLGVVALAIGAVITYAAGIPR